jgi:hypothetical protein
VCLQNFPVRAPAELPSILRFSGHATLPDATLIPVAQPESPWNRSSKTIQWVAIAEDVEQNVVLPAPRSCTLNDTGESYPMA